VVECMQRTGSEEGAAPRAEIAPSGRIDARLCRGAEGGREGGRGFH